MGQDRFEGIQAARAVAALSVVYFHSWTVLDRFPKDTAHPIACLASYGWIGVDLFFAISGFVIALVVSRPDFNAREFLIRRAFRLYPLWLLLLTLWALLAWAWRGARPIETLGYFFYSVTLLPTREFPFYDIGWSLQHEMIFYAMAAAIIPLFGIAGLTIVLALSVVANHVLPLPWYLSNLTAYHGEFLAGLLAFQLLPRLRWLGALLPIGAGLFGLYFCIFIWGDRPYFPIALFFLIIGFANLGTIRDPLLRGLVALGDASYSIYLIHPLFFTIVKAATLGFSSVLWLEEPTRWTAIMLALILAEISWRTIEAPMISLGARLSRIRLVDFLDRAVRRIDRDRARADGSRRHIEPIRSARRQAGDDPGLTKRYE